MDQGGRETSKRKNISHAQTLIWWLIRVGVGVGGQRILHTPAMDGGDGLLLNEPWYVFQVLRWLADQNPIPFVLLHAMFHLIESWYRYLPTTGRYSRVVALYGIRHCTISNLDQNNCNLFRQYVAHSEHCINYK